MQKLDPKAFWIFLSNSLSVGLVFLFIFGWFGGVALFSILADSIGGIIGVIILLIILYIAFSILWAKLSYNAYKYELREDAFRKESGVIWKRYVSIPYERIQNVDIHRGILARILGLSDLMIQTAGFSGNTGGRGGFGRDPEGRLPGVTREVAEQLRDDLVRRAKSNKQGL